jgi:TonB-dependent SusC/RagA subfamily outer membrane receptor
MPDKVIGNGIRNLWLYNYCKMKKSISTFGLLLCINIMLPGQVEKEITSSIKRVVLYTRGAQVESEASISLQQGQMTLKFTKLSPYIRKESIRVEGDGSFIIQNVLHQNDYINELDKNKEIEIIKKRIEEIKTNIEYEQTWIKILGDKLDFLKTNKDITGKEQAVNSEVFSSLYNLYGNTLETLNLELLKKERLLNDYNKDAAKLDNQLSSLNNKADLPSGTILVTVNSKQAKNAKIKFSYLVENASWYPSYDIRFTGVDKPLIITFKANISQNTGVDWTDVNLVLSTAKTNISAQIPVLSPFYLQFYYPEITRALQGRVSGVMISENAEVSAAESQIRLRGTSSLNEMDNPLYVVDGVPQNNISSLDPNLIDNIQVLKDASSTSVYGSRGVNGVILVTTKKDGEKSSIPLTITSKREVSNEYIVEMPQTILSKDKINTITFREANLNALFEYQTVPLKSGHVFLIGRVNDWYKTDLLDGEANVYLENSYVGKSTINTQQFTDTLELSFGVDNNISVKREKLTDFSESQFIGSNKKETLAFKLTLRNNKVYPVRTKITDQIPVSTTKDIQVETLEVTGGKVNSDTGEVFWDVELKPGEMKDLVLKYSVRYPKNKKVIIE